MKKRPMNNGTKPKSCPTVTGTCWRRRRKKIRSAPHHPTQTRLASICRHQKPALGRRISPSRATTAGAVQRTIGTRATSGWLSNARPAKVTSSTNVSGASLASSDPAPSSIPISR